MSKFEVLDYELEGKNFKFETCLEMIADALDDMPQDMYWRFESQFKERFDEFLFDSVE